MTPRPPLYGMGTTGPQSQRRPNYRNSFCGRTTEMQRLKSTVSSLNPPPTTFHLFPCMGRAHRTTTPAQTQLQKWFLWALSTKFTYCKNTQVQKHYHLCKSSTPHPHPPQCLPLCGMWPTRLMNQHRPNYRSSETLYRLHK